MDEVTKEDLRQYMDLCLEIEAIQMQIESLYTPISSAPMFSDGGHSNVPGNPTERAVFKIEAQREKLQRKQEELLQMRQRVEDWLNSLEDHHIAAIIRFHFISGLSWRQTCKRVYGYADPDICRIAFNRFMAKRRNRRETQ